MIGIYKITNAITNLSYIGQSIHIEQRWREHKTRYKTENTKFYKAIQIYGIENFIFEVLEECTAEELDEKEKYWINKFNSFQNGYNSNQGGQSQTIDNSEIIYSLWDQGYSVSDIILKTKLSHSTIYNYLNCYSNYSVAESNRRGGLKALQSNNQSPNSKIYRYDEYGNYIDEWDSTKEIERILKIDSSSIGKALRGLRKSAGGFYWSTNKTDKIKNINLIRKPRQVEQLDLQGNYIRSFPSFASAARAFGRQDGSAIRKVCNGKMPTAYGYRWRYRED